MFLSRVSIELKDCAKKMEYNLLSSLTIADSTWSCYSERGQPLVSVQKIKTSCLLHVFNNTHMYLNWNIKNTNCACYLVNKHT